MLNLHARLSTVFYSVHQALLSAFSGKTFYYTRQETLKQVQVTSFQNQQAKVFFKSVDQSPEFSILNLNPVK